MEHVNAEILRAIADGKKVQYRDYCSPSGWEYFHNADSATCWKVLTGGVNVEWRIAPKTIKIGEHEVPEPCREVLAQGVIYWAFTPFMGVVRVGWYDSTADHLALKGGFIHLTKEAAEQHYEAIKSLLAKT